jgi:hypothetical protein
MHLRSGFVSRKQDFATETDSRYKKYKESAHVALFDKSS